MIRFRGIACPTLTEAEQAWACAELPEPNARAAQAGAVFAATPVRAGSSAAEAIYRDDTLLVIAHARIDALPELREALGELAPPDPAAGPAAHIAAAWRRWGRTCPQHLLGDYAFAIHDPVRGETFCVLDHIGARPFYYVQDYFQDRRRLAFAGEIEPLLDLDGVSRELDESVVATALLFRDFEPRRTFHRAIRKLPAGHCLHLTASETRLERWWKPERIAVRHRIGDAEAIAETRRLVCQAVEDRLAGHHQTAVHLSGGIDSSLVAALAARTVRSAGKPDPAGYCWQGLDGEALPDNEIGWVTSIAEDLGLAARAPRLTPAELAALLLADWTTGPDAKNLFHEQAIQQAAEDQGITLILSGWGGDEGFSFHGRGMNPQLLLTGRWLTLFREAQEPGLKGGLRAIYGAARRLAVDWIAPHPGTDDLIRRGKSLIEPGFARRTPLLPLTRIRELGVRSTQIALLRHGSPTSRIEDWAVSGARHGIEYGYPLLDRRLLEFVLSLPPRMFKRRGVDRWLARETARGLIPELLRANTSKDELQRAGQLAVGLAEAFRLIAPRLDDPAAPLTRARYIDMAALRRHLAAADASGSGLGRGLRTAIQFLDLQ